MQQGQITSINWNNANNFAGYIVDNNIFYFNGEHIGVTLAKFQEVANALQKCKNRLIELGEIKVPKTPEQIMQEQAALIEKQSQAINQLLEKMNEPRPNNVLSSEGPQGKSEDSDTNGASESRPDNSKNKRRCAKSDTESTDSQ